MYYPRSQKRDLHPKDEDLSLGAPDLGHPKLVATITKSRGHGTCSFVLPAIEVFAQRAGVVAV
jgi:hypothetical protein